MGRRVALARAMTGARCAAMLVVLLMAANPAAGQEPTCRILCAPTLLFEPTLTLENPSGPSDNVFEVIFALDVPTRISRIGLSLEAITTPFARNDQDGRDNAVELESEINFVWLDSTKTRGWISSHFDVVDKFSPAERASDLSSYTHKLNFELDTAVAAFRRSANRWLRDFEIEGSVDYVATGLPKDAPRWSLSLVLVVPLTGI